MRLTNEKREHLLKFALDNTNLDQKIVKDVELKYAAAKLAVETVIAKAFPEEELKILRKHNCTCKYSRFRFKGKSSDNNLTGFELEGDDEVEMSEGHGWFGKTMECPDSVVTKIKSYNEAKEKYDDHKRQRRSDFKTILHSVNTFKRLCEVCDLFEGASNLFSHNPIAVLDKDLNQRVAKYRK